MKNKKGADAILTAVVIIILLIILVGTVSIVYGGSYSDFRDTVFSFGGGKPNLQTRLQGCDVMCQKGQTAQEDYCIIKKKVIFNEDKNDERNGDSYSCQELAMMGVGLTPCSNIECPPPVLCQDMQDEKCGDDPNCLLDVISDDEFDLINDGESGDYSNAVEVSGVFVEEGAGFKCAQLTIKQGTAV